MTITGTNLTGANRVKFNTTTAATFTVVSSTTITAPVPVGATTGLIALSTPGGVALSATNFTVVPPPTITSFAPASGAIGNTVTITGTNLTGGTAVTFNTTAATAFTVVSATSVTATVPVGATTGLIKVTTGAGTATSSSAFTVSVAPTYLSNLSLNSSGIIGGTNVTGTVTLNQPAPNGGLLINLHTSNSAAATPLTVTIPSGTLFVQFTVTTQSVSIPTITTILGDSNGWAQAANLTVLPTSQTFAISNFTALPGNAIVVLKWNDLPPGSIQGYKVYRNGILLTTVPQEVATFADMGLSNGTAYQYQVSVVTTAGQEINLSTSVSATPTSSLASLNWINPPATASGSINFSAQLSSGINSSEYLLLVDGKQAGVGGSEPTNTGSMGPVIVNLDTTSLSNGSHMIQLVSSDGFVPSATTPINVQVANVISNINIGGLFDPSAHEALPLDVTTPSNTTSWTVTITDDTTSSTLRTWNGIGSNIHFAWDGVGSVFGDIYDTITVIFQGDDGTSGTASFPITTVMGNPGGLALIDYISDRRAHDIALAASIKAAFTQFHNTDSNFNGIVLNPYSAGGTTQEKYATYGKIRNWMTNTLVDFYLFGHGRGQQTLNDPRPQRSVWAGANFFPKKPLDPQEFAAVTGDPIRNFVIPDFINGRNYNFVFIDSCFSAGGVDIPGNANDGDPGNPVLTQWHDAFGITEGDFGGGTSLGFNGTNQLNTLVDGSQSPWLVWRQYLWSYLSVNGTTVQSAINSATTATQREISVGNLHSTFTYPWESKYGYSRLQQSDYSAYTFFTLIMNRII